VFQTLLARRYRLLELLSNVFNFVQFVADFLENGRCDLGKELSDKLICIRFIVGLLEHREDVTVSSSQQSSSDEEDCYDQGKRLLKPDCLKFFDKVAAVYPFSDVEKSHIRSTLKLQVTLDQIANDHSLNKIASKTNSQSIAWL